MISETSSIYAIIQFLEYSDPIDNVTQCILWNSSNFSLLEYSPKRGYGKNGRLYSILVCSEDPTCTACPHAQYLTSDSETLTQETAFRTISNGSGPT